jgi:hypothetical protein
MDLCLPPFLGIALSMQELAYQERKATTRSTGQAA